jgi:hypothetical protein
MCLRNAKTQAWLMNDKRPETFDERFAALRKEQLRIAPGLSPEEIGALCRRLLAVLAQQPSVPAIGYVSLVSPESDCSASRAYDAV